MPTNPWRASGSIACALMTTSCAGSAPIFAAPPRLGMPAAALEACDLYRLPDAPSLADLEIGYATRGAQILACDGRRRLAVETAAAGLELETLWAAAREARRRPWRRFW